MTFQVWDRVSDASEQVCLVRCEAEEQNMTVKFVLNGTERRLNRNQSEQLCSTFARLKKTLQSKSKKVAESSEQLEVALLSQDGNRIPAETENCHAWQTGHRLIIGEAEFTCLRNHPTVDSVEIKQPAIQGFSIYPLVSKSYADALYFRWSILDGESWRTVSESQIYVPASDVVGCRLKVEVVPVSTKESGESVVGQPMSMELPEVVQARRDLSVYEERVRHVAETDSQRASTLRIVSYNLLADGTPAQRSGEYDYCAAEAMDMNYRKQLLTWELMQYDADVICLQEVTPHAYRTYIEPVLQAAGWTGVYCNKNFNAQMACAVFFKSHKFELYAEERVDLHREWAESKDSRNNLRSLVPETLRAELDRANTVGQIVALVERGGEEEDFAPTFIVNTHLMGCPRARLGRTVQVAAILRRLRMCMADCGAFDAPTVFAGDFNATPEEPAHELLSTGRFPRKHAAWAHAHAVYADAENCNANARKAPAVEGADLAPGFCFRRSGAGVSRTFVNPASPCGGAVVDFVYFSRKHFEVQDLHFPEFRLRDLLADTAIPSHRFGSDHVAVVQDLVRTSRSEAA